MRERKNTVEVVAVILVVDRRVLLVRKANTTKFMLPGGKRDPGEDDVSCCVREIREELNLELQPEKLISLGTHCEEAANEPDTTVVAAVYDYAGSLGEPTVSAEIAEMKWYCLEEKDAVEYPLAPLMVKMLPHIRNARGVK